MILINIGDFIKDRLVINEIGDDGFSVTEFEI